MKMELYCLSFLDVESLEDTLWCQSVLADASEVKVGGKSKGTLHGTQWNCRAFLDIFALSTVTWGLLLTKLSKFCYDVMVLLLNIPVASSPCIYTNFHHYFSHHWLMEQGCRSDKSTHLPPTWPAFDSETWRYVWVELVGSLLCYGRFFSGYSGFLLSSKTSLRFDMHW